jgi:phospholipid transport system substrate-binding protein
MKTNKIQNNFILAAFITFLLCLVAFAGNTIANDTNAAKEYLDKTSQLAIDIIKSKDTDNKKAAALEKVFVENTDTSWMANFVIGRYIREATPAQKTKYFDLYKKYLINSYVPKFKQYTGQDFKINSVTEVGKGELIAKTAIVSSKSSTGTILVDYRIIKSGSSFKIVDIIGEGVSLITTQRSDFGGLISQKGFEFFLTKLEEKVKKQEAENAEVKKENTENESKKN